MPNEFNRYEVLDLMEESRRRTRQLLDLVIAETDLRRSPGQGYRPLLWHLGHVGAFEEYWLLQRLQNLPPISRQYGRIFDPIKTPRADSDQLPPVPEINNYLEQVRQGVSRLLDHFRPASDPLTRDGYLFNLVIEHEYQHQETLAYLLQMLDPKLKKKVVPRAIDENEKPVFDSRLQTGPKMAAVSGGAFEMGALAYPFTYDNEQPRHEVELRDFRIDRYPVTNRDFAQFIEAGGYRTRSLWSEEGWAWKQENGIEGPLYWLPMAAGVDPGGENWLVREMFGESRIRPDDPVTGVSWFEASSYARFAGQRLPTEAEWEKAASWEPMAGRKRRFAWGHAAPHSGLANFDCDRWGTTPVAAFPDGLSAYGCFNMTGNVWEWTATVFSGYDGFKAFPYAEYSELWFDGDHRVLKGGSWATRAPLLRCSFRNFFRPGFRIAFAGFRCAAD